MTRQGYASVGWVCLIHVVLIVTPLHSRVKVVSSKHTWIIPSIGLKSGIKSTSNAPVSLRSVESSDLVTGVYLVLVNMTVRYYWRWTSSMWTGSILQMSCSVNATTCCNNDGNNSLMPDYSLQLCHNRLPPLRSHYSSLATSSRSVHNALSILSHKSFTGSQMIHFQIDSLYANFFYF